MQGRVSLPFAQASRRRGPPPEDPFLCSGSDSPIRCADCGMHFSVTVHQRGKVYEDGEPRRHYRVLKRAGGCGRTIADQRVLDKVIKDLTLQRLTDPQQLAMMRQIQSEHQAQRMPHVDEIKRHIRLRTYWDQRLFRGEIPPDQHAPAVDDLNAAITQRQEELDRLDALPVPDLDDKAAGWIVDSWEAGSPADRRENLRRAWRGFQIFVEPGSSTDTESQVRKRVSRPRRMLPRS